MGSAKTWNVVSIRAAQTVRSVFAIDVSHRSNADQQMIVHRRISVPMGSAYPWLSVMRTAHVPMARFVGMVDAKRTWNVGLTEIAPKALPA